MEILNYENGPPYPPVECIKVWKDLFGVKILVFVKKKPISKKNPPPITPTKPDSDLAKIFFEIKLLVGNLPP